MAAVRREFIQSYRPNSQNELVKTIILWTYKGERNTKWEVEQAVSERQTNGVFAWRQGQTWASTHKRFKKTGK